MCGCYSGCALSFSPVSRAADNRGEQLRLMNSYRFLLLRRVKGMNSKNRPARCRVVISDLADNAC